MTSILKTTELYERRLSESLKLVQSDINFKHQQMSLGCFPFLRATFYRWAQICPEVCPKLKSAPLVLGVGDLHVENFGTWRDSEGRLVWGVNDFDEAAIMPYCLDLTRLAVSANLEFADSHLRVDSHQTCATLLRGYRDSLRCGGEPCILAEKNDWLRRLAQGELRNPIAFWRKMDGMNTIEKELPESASQLLKKQLPDKDLPHRIVARRSGLGSLGRQRFVALAEWRGGRIAREVKASAPSAWEWANPKTTKTVNASQKLASKAVRCPDPFLSVNKSWICRRLAPDCSRVELGTLHDEENAVRLLYAMGFETGNIHLASPKAIPIILKDLETRGGSEWLQAAAEAMTKATKTDWKDWKNRDSKG